MTKDHLNVLIVEDDGEIAALYRSWVFDEWEVTVAESATSALDVVSPDTDVAVLDRQLPDGSGDEVLRKLRARGNDCPVVIVTALEPGFDVIEMSFDDYLVKPFKRETFRRTLSQVADRIAYDEELREFFALTSKKALLEARTTAAERRESDEFAELEAKVERQHERVDAMLTNLSTDGYAGLFRGLFAESTAPASE